MNKNAQARLDQIFKPYPKQRLENGTILYEPMEEISHLSYINSGIVKQYVLTSKGEEVVIHLYQKPSVMPILVVMAGKTNHTYFEAIDDVEIIKAPMVDVYDQILSEKECLSDFAHRFASAVYGLTSRIISLTTQQQKDQLHQLLHYFAGKQGHDQQSEWLVIKQPLTHGQIASWLGTARETVSRLFKQLEKEGKIKYQGKNLLIQTKMNQGIIGAD